MKKELLQTLAKRCLLLAAVVLMSAVAMAEDGVIVKLKNGSEVGFVFSSKPNVAPGAELAITTSDGTKVSYDYADVRSVRFGEVTSTGIDDVETSSSCDVVFHFLDGRLSVEGLPAGESVSVCTVGGQLLATEKQSADGTALSVPLDARGVLIVRTSTGVSYKVMNK
jgi:hypothetical protein